MGFQDYYGEYITTKKLYLLLLKNYTSYNDKCTHMFIRYKFYNVRYNASIIFMNTGKVIWSMLQIFIQFQQMFFTNTSEIFTNDYSDPRP